MIVIVLWLLAQSGTPNVTLTLKPAQCFDPCDMLATINITNYERDREVCLTILDTAESLPRDPSRRSCWPWSGRRMTEVSVRSIPPGTYDVTATLTLADGRRDTRTLRVGQYGDVLKWRPFAFIALKFATWR